jgi:hypothetical protein
MTNKILSRAIGICTVLMTMTSLSHVRALGADVIQATSNGAGSSVTHRGETRPLDGTQSVSVGDTVRTSSSGAIIKFSDGTDVDLGPSTIMTLQGPTPTHTFRLAVPSGSLTVSASASQSHVYEIRASVGTVYFHRSSGGLKIYSNDQTDIVGCVECASHGATCRSSKPWPQLIEELINTADFFVVDNNFNCFVMEQRQQVTVTLDRGISAYAADPNAFAGAYIRTFRAPSAASAIQVLRDASRFSSATSSISGTLYKMPAENLHFSGLVLQPNSHITINPRSVGNLGSLQGISNNPTISVHQNSDGSVTLTTAANAHGGAFITDNRGNYGVIRVSSPPFF